MEVYTVEYFIIGNSADAVGTIESTRWVDSKSNLTVISKEKEHLYSRLL